MRSSPKWKRLLILAWACTLAFGLTFQAEQADALHASCTEQCEADCDSGCGGASGGGCYCFWVCDDGSSSDSICV